MSKPEAPGAPTIANERPRRLLQQRPDAVVADGGPDVVLLDVAIVGAAAAGVGILDVMRFVTF